MISTEFPRAWLPALMLLGLIMAGAMVRAAQPLPGGVVALVFPPWWPVARIASAAAAEGRIIRLGRWSSVVVIQPDPTVANASSQAWLRVNPIVAGCGDAG